MWSYCQLVHLSQDATGSVGNAIGGVSNGTVSESLGNTTAAIVNGSPKGPMPLT